MSTKRKNPNSPQAIRKCSVPDPMPKTSSNLDQMNNSIPDGKQSVDDGIERLDMIEEYCSFFDVRKLKWQNKEIVAIPLDMTDLKAIDVNSLMLIGHPNIVELYALDDEMNILMEYSDCGSLKDYMHGNEQREYTVKDLLCWMHQAAKGLQYVHSMEPKLFFQVIEPKRLMLSNSFSTLKICGILGRFSTTEWSLEYASPEFLKDKNLTHQCNVYSFGVNLWELMSRKQPLCHLNCPYYKIKDKVLEGERPKLSEIQILNSEPIKDFIEACWNSDPVERPTIEEVLSKIDNILQSFDSSTLDQVLSANIGAVMNFETIELGEKISDGHFGVTYKATWYSSNIAVKKLKHTTADQSIKQRCRQLMAYNGLQHENIVNIIGIAMDGQSKYLLMDYVESGSLFDHLQNLMKPISIDIAFKWMISVAKAIDYLVCEMNLNPFYLCNLKSKNIMFEPEFLDRLEKGTIIYDKVPKLCNFCLAFDDINVLKNNLSPSYTAPEVFKAGEFTEQSIVFTFGIIFWEVMARKKPFYEYEGNQILIRSAVKRGRRPDFKDIAKTGSNLLEIFLTKCWNEQPKDRHKLNILLKELQNLESEIKRFEKRLTIDFAEIKELNDQIGESKFGIVYKTIWRDLEISVKKCKSVFENNITPDLMQEITRLLHVDHENVVRLYGICYDREIVHLLMEYADCGSLYSYLHLEAKRDYAVINAIHWMHQAAKGIDHLLNGINIPVIHCNINSQNLLLFENFRLLKITDYCFPADKKKRLNYQDIAYVAPEIFEEDEYSKESDIYSFGIVLWEVMSGKKPYYEVEDPGSPNNIDEIINGRRPSLSDVRESEFTFIEDTIKKCWDGDPKNRPSISQLVEQLKLEPEMFNNAANSEFELAPAVNFKDIDFQEACPERGTFGVFYKAKWCDIKTAVQKCTRTNFGEEFENVIRKLSRVNHVNIMRVYGFTFDDEYAYMLMEHFDCISLHKYLHGEEKLEYTVARGINWMIQCAKGLAYLHAKTLVHGFLTPFNLHLLQTKNYRILKICDFGIAHELSTPVEVRKLTFDYIHPEVVAKQVRYTDRHDFYSFGTILWEVLTRKKASFKIRKGEPESRSTVWPILIIDGSERLENVIKRCWLSLSDSALDIKWIVSELTNILTTSESSIVQQVLVTIEKDKWEKLADRKVNNKSYEPEVDYAEVVNFDDIEINELLGSGAYGSVNKAKWSNQTIALKKYRYISTENKYSFKNEIKQLSRLVHDNIVKLKGVSFNSENTFLLMEYADCGSLYDFVHGNKQRGYKMSDGLNLMAQLVKVIDFMHGQKPPVVHRDLKTQNILLFNEFKHLKICDFGTVKELTTLNSLVGTPGYYAPEVDKQTYTEKCDIYSFGIILWEVMSRKKPFDHLPNPNVHAILYYAGMKGRPDLSAVVPKCEELHKLITICWDHDPEKRPDAKSIQLSEIPISEDIYIIRRKENESTK